jgi:hypothetical protein
MHRCSDDTEEQPQPGTPARTVETHSIFKPWLVTSTAPHTSSFGPEHNVFCDIKKRLLPRTPHFKIGFKVLLKEFTELLLQGLVLDVCPPNVSLDLQRPGVVHSLCERQRQFADFQPKYSQWLLGVPDDIESRQFDPAG